MGRRHRNVRGGEKLNTLTDENKARLSLIAGLAEDMRDRGGNTDQEIFSALQDYLNRRWRPQADALSASEK